jgi:uncharacterized cupin superfamily protein
MNIWDDDWGEQDEDWSGGDALGKALVPAEALIGAALYELDPGDFVVYHAHHGAEELLIVLRGRPTLRTPDGERSLDDGEVVYFSTGPKGAHGLRNDTDQIVRYVMASTRPTTEVVEYPDLGKITGQSDYGAFFIHDLDPE